jgi:hypothetical protein
MICFPPPGDMGRRRHDMALRDLSVPPDGGGYDLGIPPDGGVSDGGPPPGGCTRDTQCPGGRCDWLTGQCVPIMSCNHDSDCGFGAACVAHQCLAIQVCLPFPFPGLSACPRGQYCQFPPGVCVPDPNCFGVGCAVGEHCVSGYCQPDSCVGSADCNDGYDCINGQCLPRRYCGPFERCPAGESCVTHVCQ